MYGRKLYTVCCSVRRTSTAVSERSWVSGMSIRFMVCSFMALQTINSCFEETRSSWNVLWGGNKVLVHSLGIFALFQLYLNKNILKLRIAWRVSLFISDCIKIFKSFLSNINNIFLEQHFENGLLMKFFSWLVIWEFFAEVTSARNNFFDSGHVII